MIAAYIALGLVAFGAAWYLNELHERQTRALDEAIDALDDLYGLASGAPLTLHEFMDESGRHVLAKANVFVPISEEMMNDHPTRPKMEMGILRTAEHVLAQHDHTYRRGDGSRCRICRKHLGAHVTEGVAIDA